MTLIKLNADHYIIVEDSEIKEGDYYWNELDKAVRVNNTINHPYHKKITHSTEPIEHIVVDVTPTGDAIEGYVYGNVQELSLSEVKKLLGEVDVEKMAEERYPIIMRTITKIGGGTYDTDVNFSDRYSYKNGYNQALEDNKDRKYTEEDMRVAIRLAATSKYDHRLEFYSEEEIFKILQPPTSWDAEFVNGKLKLI